MNLNANRKEDVENYNKWEIKKILSGILRVVIIHKFVSFQRTTHEDRNKTKCYYSYQREANKVNFVFCERQVPKYYRQDATKEPSIFPQFVRREMKLK